MRISKTFLLSTSTLAEIACNNTRNIFFLIWKKIDKKIKMLQIWQYIENMRISKSFLLIGTSALA